MLLNSVSLVQFLLSISLVVSEESSPSYLPVVDPDKLYHLPAGENAEPTIIKSPGPSLDTCSRLVYLATAAYCSQSAIQAWNCPSCTEAAWDGYEIYKIFTNSEANTLCYLAQNKDKKELAFACRGSWNVANVVQDINIDQQVPLDCKDNATNQTNTNATIWVHKGFYEAICSVYPEILDNVTQFLKENEGFKVLFAGHSLGAAMSDIAAYLMINYSGLPLDTFTTYCGFGAPRPGNKGYADWWNQQTATEITRVNNVLDVIPHVPPSIIGYVHHGTELWFNGNMSVSCSKEMYEDPNCSNAPNAGYNMIDHTVVWNVSVVDCAVRDPVHVVRQSVIPFKFGN